MPGEPEVRIEDESGDTRLAGSLFAPIGTPSGRFLKTGANGVTSWGTGGGGGGGVQVATVPVSSAQILDLANTPVTLIPGVANNVTVVVAVAIAYIAGLVPYLDGGGNIKVVTGGFSEPISPWFDRGSASFWDQATSQIYAGGPVDNSPVVTPATDLAGVDVTLLQDTANPTLGDGTLLVTVAYFLAPTV